MVVLLGGFTIMACHASIGPLIRSFFNLVVVCRAAAHPATCLAPTCRAIGLASALRTAGLAPAPAQQVTSPLPCRAATRSVTCLAPTPARPTSLPDVGKLRTSEPVNRSREEESLFEKTVIQHYKYLYIFCLSLLKKKSYNYFKL